MTSKAECYFNSDGTKIWYKNGKYHREDGPAFEYSDGKKIWHKDGMCHREDGPAVIYEDGRHLYYLNGTLYTKEEYWEEIEKIKKRKEGKREK